MMSNKKLKPCFCGRTPEIVTRDVEPQEDRFFSGKTIMFVLCECGQCLFDGAFHEGFLDESEAITAWNYRVAPSPVVISEMETPTPETDAAEAMVEQANFENTRKGQERSRKEAAWEFARSLETRLAAAEAELAAMRSGEATFGLCVGCNHAPHAKSNCSRGCECICDHEARRRSPVPASVVEALEDAAKSLEAIGRDAGRDEFMGTFPDIRGYADNRAAVARAALSTLTKGAKE